MKALTICQPYAHLIRLPTDDPRHKRVENRTWYTSYRGPLYIHAGKSRQWMDVEDGIEMAYQIPAKELVFGAVIAVAELVDCLRSEHIMRGNHDAKYLWLRAHQHVNGPYCWILDHVAPIGPWPYRGAQGLFDITDRELDAVANRALGITARQA